MKNLKSYINEAFSQGRLADFNPDLEPAVIILQGQLLDMQNDLSKAKNASKDPKAKKALAKIEKLITTATKEIFSI